VNGNARKTTSRSTVDERRVDAMLRDEAYGRRTIRDRMEEIQRVFGPDHASREFDRLLVLSHVAGFDSTIADARAAVAKTAAKAAEKKAKKKQAAWVMNGDAIDLTRKASK